MIIKPFTIAISSGAIIDLKQRLAQARWPETIETDDWSRGVPHTYLKKIVGYWQHTYDWSAQQEKLNTYPQFIATIDGQPIHFIHIKSKSENAIPLLLNHGYPGSIVELLPLIDHLVNPVKARQAFHIIAPSLPGFGFSNPVRKAGWDIARTAKAYASLMKELGYAKYGVQGSDIGAGICQQLCLIDPEHIIGAHTSNDPTSLALTGILSIEVPDLLAGDIRKFFSTSITPKSRV